jgi:hypothetical protein
MDIVVWLRGLGLGKYEAAFRENEIDETVLPSLTAENLKELGVTALGHRVKLLDAIAALRADAGAKAPTLAEEPAPLIGREEEIALLMRRWERARQGDGQLALILGEPGVGKSRLIEEFHARLREVPHTWVEWNCSQLLQNTPLHPIAEWGRQRFGGSDMSAEQRLADLESTLAQIKLDPAENVPLLAPLLDIPVSAERALALAPEELRRRQLAAFTSWVMAGARTQLAVLALEDLHWADPTTLDLMRGIAERGALAPLFVLISARPEFRPPWGMRSHHGMISLAPLDRHQVQQMIGGLAARHALPKEGIDGVTAHRRCAAVCGGSDAALIGAWRTGRGPGHPADAATITDGAARPAWLGARGSADRRRYRTRLLLWAPSRRGWNGRHATASSPSPSYAREA